MISSLMLQTSNFHSKKKYCSCELLVGNMIGRRYSFIAVYKLTEKHSIHPFCVHLVERLASFRGFICNGTFSFSVGLECPIGSFTVKLASYIYIILLYILYYIALQAECIKNGTHT